MPSSETSAPHLSRRLLAIPIYWLLVNNQAVLTRWWG